MTPQLPVSDSDATAQSCLTLRSVVIGLFFCVLIGLAGPYWTVYRMLSGMFADYHAAGPVFCLLTAILFFNILLGLLSRRLRLSGGELRVITAMCITSGAIVVSGLIAYLIPGMTAPYYHATPANQIHTRVWPLLEELSMQKWLFAVDPNGGHVAITKWWAGIPVGEPIPWGPWVKPLVWWGVFVTAIFGCMIALMSVMRKQWVDYEHLSFPIAQVPDEVCRAVERPGSATVMRSKVFWLGVGFAVLVGLCRGLSNHFPGIPAFRIQHTVSGLGPMNLRVSVSLLIIGLVFLVPSRVAFSIWSLNLASWILRSFLREYGFTLDEWMLYGVVGHGELSHVAMGAMAAFAAGSVWMARRHLLRALRCVFGSERGYDRGEPLSYRAAFVIMTLGLGAMIVWFHFLGLRPHYALILLLVTFIIYYALARVIAQCGLPAINSPAVPSVWMSSAFGSSLLGARQSVALGAHLMWHQDLRNSAMSGAAHGMYLTGRRGRGLFWVLMAGLLVTYTVGSLCTIYLGYRHGGSTLHDWYINLSSQLAWMWSSSKAQGLATASTAGLTWTGVGAVVMALLLVAQRLFFWWPLHPVGFITSGTFLVTVFWFSVFLSWLLKVLLVYLGGAKAYRTARRFFIGGVLGTFACAGLWAVVDTWWDGGGGIFSL